MDGSTASLIVIPIVVGLALAVWLLLVAYAAVHPQWRHNAIATGPGNAGRARGHVRPAGPRPADLAPGSAGQDAPPQERARRAA